MARKLEQKQNQEEKKNEKPVEVARLSNLTGFDPDQLLADIGQTISLGEEASEARIPWSDHKKHLKAERGYHMGGFAACVKLERMDDIERRDWWMTVSAYAAHKGLSIPDLVGLMEGADA